MVPTTCWRPMYCLSTRKSAVRRRFMAASWTILCSVLVICREGWIPAKLVEETCQFTACCHSKYMHYLLFYCKYLKYSNVFATWSAVLFCFRATLEVHWLVTRMAPVLFMVWWVGETNVERRTSLGSTHASLTFWTGSGQRLKQHLHKQHLSLSNMTESEAKDLTKTTWPAVVFVYYFFSLQLYLDISISGLQYHFKITMLLNTTPKKVFS